MRPMENPHDAEQKHFNTRAFTLGNLRAQRPEQGFDVGPTDIRRYRPGKDQFKGALGLSLHT